MSARRPHQGGHARRVARNAAVRAAGEAIAKAASFAFYVVMARELGRSGYGAFQFGLALGGTLMLIAGLGMDQLLVREVARDRTRVAGQLADVLGVKLAAGAILLGVAAAIAAAAGHSAQSYAAVLLVCVGAGVEVVAASWHAALQAYERLDLTSLSIVVQRVATAAVGTAVLLNGGDLLAAAAVFAAGSLLGLAIAVVNVRHVTGGGLGRVDRRRAFAAMRMALPIGIGLMLLTLIMRLDAILIGFLHSDGSEEVGVYSAAFRLVEATQFISWSFAAAMMPWVSRGERGGPGLRWALALAIKALTALLLPLGLLFVLFAGPIVETIFGPQFQASALPLRLLGASVVFYALQNLGATVLVAQDAPWLVTRVLAITVVVNVAANVVLIPPYGATGAAAVALGSTLLLAAGTVGQAARIVGGLAVAKAFTGTALAGAAMAGVAIALDLPVLVEAVAGVVVYVVLLGAWELVRNPDDAAVLVRAVR